MSRVGVAVLVLIALGLAIWAPSSASAAGDPASCRNVRLSDIGWTDVAATTGVADVILTRLGYRPKISVLSVPVTYAAMKNKDIDVFLGNWMPSMAHDQTPFVADGSVRVVRPNLIGAKYTLAVPTYLYNQGLKDFSDIKRFRSALGGAIYGLEAGNDGNHQILRIIAKNDFGLGDFKLVESSEQGMLAQVERAYRAKQPVVFLGWAPHPMNTRFAMSYLTGGDAYFGKNFGGAVIYTNARAGYLEQCPNLGRLLENLSFTLVGESQLMGLILDSGKDPETAARIWLKANPGVLPVWLNGVTTFDGRPGLAAFSAPEAHAIGFSVQGWLVDHKLPVGAAVTFAIAQVKQHMTPLFDGISYVAGGLVDGLTAALVWIPAPNPDSPRRGPGLRDTPLHRPDRLRDRGPAVHRQSGLLERDGGDPVARAGGRPRLDGSRRPHRHRGRASAMARQRAATGARSDADPADLRLSHPDPGAVRTGRGAGADLDGDLRHARADPPDPDGHSLRAQGPDGGRGRRSARPRASCCGRSNSPPRGPPSWPASPSASCCVCPWW